MINKKYIVYMHVNRINNKVYIGITANKPEIRWQNGNGYKEQNFFYAIKKYGWDMFDHKILFTNLTKEEAEQKEIELIAKYKSNQREFGYNIGNGGNTYGKHNEITKKKISKKNTGKKPWLGKHHSEVTKEKLKVLRSGKGNGMYNKFNELNPRSKKCFQYDLENNLIKEYPSVREAERQTGISFKYISRCCLGKTKTTKGYKWSYEKRNVA